MSSEPTAAEIDRGLHERLLAGDPLATHDLFERHYRPLVRWLVGKYQTTEDDLIADAVTETLFDYFERPERFDPGRRGLFGYLKMSAERDLLNIRERHQGRFDHEQSAEDVELAAPERNILSNDVLDELVDHDAAEALTDKIEAMAENDEELIVLRLILAGERSTEVFARQLGLDHLAPAARRARIFPIKDRLIKRVRRRLRDRDV